MQGSNQLPTTPPNPIPTANHTNQLRETINRPTQSKETETPKGAGQKKVGGYPLTGVDVGVFKFSLI